MKIIAMIPARFEASRFPGKLMKDLAGKSVILRTYEATKKSNSTYWSEERLVNLFPMQDSTKEWMISVVESPLNMQEFLKTNDQDGSFGKMSKAFLKNNTKKPYVKSSPLSQVLTSNQKVLTNKVLSKVKNTQSLIGFSTANTSEFPNDAKESTFLDIVEKTGKFHSQYYLNKDVLKLIGIQENEIGLTVLI